MISLSLKFEENMTIKFWVIESCTLMGKVHSGVQTLSNQISLNIAAVLVEHT